MTVDLDDVVPHKSITLDSRQYRLKVEPSRERQPALAAFPVVQMYVNDVVSHRVEHIERVVSAAQCLLDVEHEREPARAEHSSQLAHELGIAAARGRDVFVCECHALIFRRRHQTRQHIAVVVHAEERRGQLVAVKYHIVGAEITSVLEASSKTVEKEGKQYTYSYYPAEYAILNDVFSEEVSGLVQSELTDRQKEILAELKQELENQSTIFKTKKEIGLILYNYFYECVQYRLKNHYLVRAFSRLVQDGIQDYTEKVLLLFE